MSAIIQVLLWKEIGKRLLVAADFSSWFWDKAQGSSIILTDQPRFDVRTGLMLSPLPAVVSTGLSHLPPRLMREIYGSDTETVLRRLIRSLRHISIVVTDARRQTEAEEKASSVNKTKPGLSKRSKFCQYFQLSRNRKNEIIYLKRHIFLIRSSSNGCNCVPVVPPPLSECNDSCCL